MKISDKAHFIRRKIVDRNIKDCKKISPEQMETIVQLSEEYESWKVNHNQVDSLRYSPDSSSNKENLLVIELENETSVPKVFYEGEEVTLLRNIRFDWETQTNEFGGTKYNIEHFEKVHNGIVRKGYGLARGKYALDGEDG
ncbi:hypothetical protein SAMN05421839_1392 [Halolactibacillus halophilus]|uniref:Uncharacterized protein n=1 Tax=Halolactibacillus halophilus TaxID=306540 RepID=A0A1I5S416_9BACI|nr:hypothetical protein [Halolactibacillus halophilus]SFP65518.1 hypothetical protein SAMN05421839_1392 [Halolactibacillus halophilus]